MILSDGDIRKALASGEIQISPSPNEQQYDSTSLDLRLGDDFQKWDTERLDPPGVEVVLDLAKQEFRKTAKGYLIDAEVERDDSVLLRPRSSTPLLGITQERIHLKRKSRIAAQVQGRSSLARLGLFVHITAPTIHAGFDGPIVLELYNVGPFCLKLTPNQTRICQLVFQRVESEPKQDAGSQFQGQSRPSGGGE